MVVDGDVLPGKYYVVGMTGLRFDEDEVFCVSINVSVESSVH